MISLPPVRGPFVPGAGSDSVRKIICSRLACSPRSVNRRTTQCAKPARLAGWCTRFSLSFCHRYQANAPSTRSPRGLVHTRWDPSAMVTRTSTNSRRSSGSGAYIRQFCSRPVADATGSSTGTSRRLSSASGRLHTTPVMSTTTTTQLSTASPTRERSNRCPIADHLLTLSTSSFVSPYGWGLACEIPHAETAFAYPSSPRGAAHSTWRKSARPRLPKALGMLVGIARHPPRIAPTGQNFLDAAVYVTPSGFSVGARHQPFVVIGIRGATLRPQRRAVQHRDPAAVRRALTRLFAGPAAAHLYLPSAGRS